MPMGSYKGTELDALPTKYLIWVVTQDSIRFKRWPLVKEILRVLRSRFADRKSLETELMMEDPPPEYWKTPGRHRQREAERAEKLRLLEAKRRESTAARLAAMRSPASIHASGSLLEPVDPNDVSDLV